MKKTSYYLIVSTTVLLLFFSAGCKKQDAFLEAKRNKADVTPETLADYQAILDNDLRLNYEYPLIGLVGSDNYYLTDADLAGATEVTRNAYLWNKDIWTGGNSLDWSINFRNIEYANVVLDGLKSKNNYEDLITYNNIKGQALFLRALCYSNLVQVFCKPYSSTTAATDLGLPVRLTSDVNLIKQRSSLEETFAQIISDLKDAAVLLPEKALYLTRANSSAAYGLLAKVYLSMRSYQQAFDYADLQLKRNGALLNFNSSFISLSLTYRFPANGIGNPEILYFSSGGGYSVVQPSTTTKGYVSPDLYKSYSSNDLRKTIFYLVGASDNLVRFRGAYTGNALCFTGIATNELYLIRAEANARLGKADAALDDLNLLLRNRFKAGLFTALSATNADQALNLVLAERRKELPFVGNLRWEDLRRLNQDSRFAITLSRTNPGANYTLTPNDKRYTMPIPDNELQASGITQNQR